MNTALVIVVIISLLVNFLTVRELASQNKRKKDLKNMIDNFTNVLHTSLASVSTQLDTVQKELTDSIATIAIAKQTTESLASKSDSAAAAAVVNAGFKKENS
jgi:hypothetical protein